MCVYGTLYNLLFVLDICNKNIQFKHELSVKDKIDLNNYVVGHADKYVPIYQERLKKYGIEVIFKNHKN